MIRNETYIDGVCVAAEVIDLAAGTFSTEEYGTITATRALTADEIAAYTPTPDPVADVVAEINAATTVTKLRAAVLKLAELVAP